DDLWPSSRNDAGVVDGANVTDEKSVPEAPDDPSHAAQAAEPQVAAEKPTAHETPEQKASEQPGSPETPSPPPQQRVWTMPKSPVTRTQADKLGRVVLDALSGITKFVAGAARVGARVITQAWHAIEAVPSAVKLLLVAGIGMLVGLVGAIALDTALGLICTVVVVPVCSLTLGALGHRWYSGLGAQRARTDTAPAQPAPSDLKRSVEYVDKKLGVALNTFGTEQHQQAVIALFQAKTAVELTLGTERDTTGYGEMPLPADEHQLRPRIRVGSTSKSLLRESNSLAAS
ncbi:MAG: hypothetical protein K0R68_3818, partial [Mycobacterium sp.]|nr:hypothetical protein [Mycobacterium sp.]